MPKRRLLTPESVYARHNLEQWLSDELGVALSEQHRQRIWKALPCASLEDIRRVPDLPHVVYEKFHEKFVLTTSRVVEEKASEHGGKLVIETQDGHLIETVLIQHHKGEVGEWAEPPSVSVPRLAAKWRVLFVPREPWDAWRI